MVLLTVTGISILDLLQETGVLYTLGPACAAKRAVQQFFNQAHLLLGYAINASPEQSRPECFKTSSANRVKVVLILRVCTTVSQHLYTSEYDKVRNQ